jgi:hypothetical protein
MCILRRFWRHDGGSSFESLALILSVVAVIAVGAADFLHYASQKDGVLGRFVTHVQTEVAELSGNAPALRGGIDYTPTGSIIGLRRAAPLNPCAASDK